jgi:hypothetical protein
MPISKLKAFNITLLHPAGFIHSLALKEAADYLHAPLRPLPGVVAAVEQFLARCNR